MASNEMRLLRRALEVVTEGGDAPGVSGFALEAVEARDQARSWTLAENIQGLGIAERITAGRRLDELVMKVYVDKKLPKSQCDRVVPERVEVPGTSQTVETDVEEIGKVELEATTGRFRPAMPGCGVGHLEVEVGTFGLLVRKRDEPEDLYVLSNSHVLANQGVCQVGDLVIQAGRYDGGLDPDDAICKLAAWVPFDFAAEGYPNLVDAAIARVKNPEEVSAAVRLIGVPGGHSTYVRRGMQVRKSGRTTDYTIGEIRDTDYRLQMWYELADGSGATGRVGLRDQVLCTRYTAPGDSGAAVFNTSDKVVGLHFAGSSSSSIFNRIANVLEALDLELVTEEV